MSLNLIDIGLRAQISPMWGWQVGWTTNVAVGAGLELGYSPTWAGISGANLGAGISGGELVAVSMMEVREAFIRHPYIRLSAPEWLSAS